MRYECVLISDIMIYANFKAGVRKKGNMDLHPCDKKSLNLMSVKHR